MKKLLSYFNKTTTNYGLIVITAGFYFEGEKFSDKDYINDIKNINIENDNLVEIDVKLAECIKLHFTNKLVFAGSCIISNRNDGLSTGGVIGQVKNNISSAESLIENLDFGYSLIAYPESPGIIFKHTLEKIEFLNKFDFNRNKIVSLIKIKDYFIKEFSKDNFLIISDGCNDSDVFISVYDGSENIDYFYNKNNRE